MSDEFLRVAAAEINEELQQIEDTLNQCSSDSDVSNHCKKIESHFHKIKGLAPMMGKTRVGKIAESVDAHLKEIISGKTINGIFNVLNDSNNFMKNEMKEETSGYEELEDKIKNLNSI